MSRREVHGGVVLDDIGSMDTYEDVDDAYEAAVAHKTQLVRIEYTYYDMKKFLNGRVGFSND